MVFPSTLPFGDFMNKRTLILVAGTALVSSLPSWGADFPVGQNSSLSVGGLFAVGLKDSQVTNVQPGDTRKPTAEIGVIDNTSRVIIAGYSEFAPGWKAIFNVESRFTTNVSPIDPLMPGLPPAMAQQYSAGNMTGWANGETWAGFSTPYGKLVFGKTTFYYLDGLNMDYFGVPGPGEGYRAWDGNGLGVFNMLSQVGTSIKLGGNAIGGLPLATMQIDRAQNAIRYDSPKMGGFDLTLAYSKNPFGEQNAAGQATASRNYEDGGTVWGRVRYNNGPFTAFASVLNSVLQGGINNSTQGIFLNDAFSAITPAIIQGPMDTHAYRFGAGYLLPGGVRVGFVYDSTAVANGIIGTNLTAKRNVLEIPVSYGWNDHRVYVTYNKAGDTSNLANSGATQMTVGYDYAFTKKMFGGIFFTQLNNNSNGNYQPFLSGTVLGNSAPATGENWHQVSIDINFWF